MHGPREAKRILNWYRKRAAIGKKKKRNGSIGWIDDPGLENLISNSKRRYQRQKGDRDDEGSSR
jgi:hypothetical protein